MTSAEKMRYSVGVVAKSTIRVWRLEYTTARKRCHTIPLFFVIMLPLYKIAGCMGRLLSLPVSVVAGSPTPCSPLSVFGETENISISHYGEIIMSMNPTINPKIAKFILPYVATILTSFPCWNWSSRLIDKLIVASETD